MLAFIIRRLLILPITLIGLSMLIFAMLQLSTLLSVLSSM